MENKVIGVYVVDDHPILREGVKTILSKIDDAEFVGEASSGQEVLDKLSEIDCDVMLLDISMPGMTGIELLDHLKGKKPEMAILMLSFHSGKYFADLCLKSGALGYLSKASAPSELDAAIHAVAQGNIFVGSDNPWWWK